MKNLAFFFCVSAILLAASRAPSVAGVEPPLTATSPEGTSDRPQPLSRDSEPLERTDEFPLEVTIIEPRPHRVFTEREAREGPVFTASVVINGAADPSQTFLSWSSSREGDLGTGIWLSVPLHQPGPQVITARANDSLGNESSHSVLVAIKGGDPTEGEPIQGLARSGLQESRPAITPDSSGGAIIVWQGDDATEGPPEPHSNSIQISRIHADDTVSEPFRANEASAGVKSNADVAAHPGGRYIVVWESKEPELAEVLKGRVFANRIPVSSEFQINEHQEGIPIAPRTAALAGGEFVVVWQTSQTLFSADTGDIFARRFDRLGNPKGEEFTVNSHTTGRQSKPAVAALPGGGFAVAWESTESDGGDRDGSSIQLRRFDESSQPLGEETQVNIETSGDQTAPALVTNDLGHVVVIWRSEFDPGDSAARTFRIAGRPGENLQDPEFRSAGEFVVTETGGENQELFDLALDMSSNGDFLVSWAQGPVRGPFALQYLTFFFLEATPSRSSTLRNLQFPTDGRAAVSFVGSGNRNDFLIFWQITESAAQPPATQDLVGRRITLQYDTLTLPSDIFADGFESGDTSAWSSVTAP